MQMKQERQVIACEIEKGMKHGQKIIHRGEADQLPGTIPGDVVFVLACQKHDRFIRKNDDLLYQVKIPLVQALTGCAFTITHLDGRSLVCRTQRGEVVTPGHIKVIAEEGFPTHKNPFVKVRECCLTSFPPPRTSLSLSLSLSLSRARARARSEHTKRDTGRQKTSLISANL